MRPGSMAKAGDVILAKVQFIDTFEVKTRPAVVLFEEFDNVVVVGITSNTNMKGIPLTKKEGAVKNSVIKTNYIFTISKTMISKVLFHLNSKKKEEIFKGLVNRLESLRRL
jgi:mRNA interferase MazF